MADEENSIRALVNDMLSKKDEAKIKKMSRSVYLSDHSYLALKSFCEDKGWSVAVVVDKLIEQFMDEADPRWRTRGK